MQYLLSTAKSDSQAYLLPLYCLMGVRKQCLDKQYPNTKVVIPPDKGAKISRDNHEYRNENLRFIKNHGRMHWQRTHQYGKRNLSEMAIQRYKRILGPKLHSREFTRQKQEALIGTSILNKMTSLGMPDSQRRK